MTLCTPVQLACASVLEVHGRLRVPATTELRSRVDAVLRRGNRRLLLDLSGVLAIDAAGVGELIQVFNMITAEGGVLRIRGASGRVHRLLELAGLLQLLNVS